jgi:hypothetical protein
VKQGLEGSRRRIQLGLGELVMESFREYLLAECCALSEGSLDLGTLLTGCVLEGVDPRTPVNS